MSDKEGITPEIRSKMFNSLSEGAKKAVLSNIEGLGQAVGKKMAGHAEVVPSNFQELVKYMSDEEREALIKAADKAQREELKRLHGE